MTGASAVLDTNILVSALLSPHGNPAKVYRMFLTKTLKVVYSAGILAEYNDVLLRPRLRIPSEAAETVLKAILTHGEQTEPVASTHDMVDEDDRIFYDTARSAGSYLITGNTKHYPDEDFILTPTRFLTL